MKGLRNSSSERSSYESFCKGRLGDGDVGVGDVVVVVIGGEVVEVEVVDEE